MHAQRPFRVIISPRPCTRDKFICPLSNSNCFLLRAESRSTGEKHTFRKYCPGVTGVSRGGGFDPVTPDPAVLADDAGGSGVCPFSVSRGRFTPRDAVFARLSRRRGRRRGFRFLVSRGPPILYLIYYISLFPFFPNLSLYAHNLGGPRDTKNGFSGFPRIGAFYCY